MLDAVGAIAATFLGILFVGILVYLIRHRPPNQVIAAAGTCCVCMDANATTRLPCGHQALCRQCANRLDAVPYAARK